MKEAGGIPHLKGYFYILTFQFFKIHHCVWSACMCGYMGVCTVLSFYLGVNSRDGAQATRLMGQALCPPSESESSC